MLEVSLARQLAPLDVTPSQWRLLSAVFHDEASSVKRLAEHLGLDAGAVTRLTDRLAAKGLAERIPDARDARSMHIALTPQGQALVPQLASIASVHDAHWFGVLGPKGERRFRKLLRKLMNPNGAIPKKSWVKQSRK